MSRVNDGWIRAEAVRYDQVHPQALEPKSEEVEVTDHFRKAWVLFCPWCGRRADLNTIKPLTINCDVCECTTEVKTIT